MPTPELWTLPVGELRGLAAKDALVHDIWPQSDLSTRTIREVPLAREVTAIQLLPGGSWMVEVLSSGNLRLRMFETLGADTVGPNAVVSLPDFLTMMDFHLAVIPGRDPVFVSHYTSPADHDRIRVFSVDTTTPALELLTELNFPTSNRLMTPSMSDNLLSFMVGDCPLLVVRRIGPHNEDTVQQTGEASHGEDGPTLIRVISETRVILLEPESINMFDLPQMSSQPSVGAITEASAIPVEPVVIYTFDRVSPSVANRSIWSGFPNAHRLPFVVRTWDEVAGHSSSVVHILDQCTTTQPQVSTVTLPMESRWVPFGMGLRRSVCLYGNEHLKLWFIAFDPLADSKGWTADSFRVGSLLLSHNRHPVSFGFDEISGRVCLVMRDDGFLNHTGSMLVIDVKDDLAGVRIIVSTQVSLYGKRGLAFLRLKRLRNCYSQYYRHRANQYGSEYKMLVAGVDSWSSSLIRISDKLQILSVSSIQ
ncbi:hypothetical protein JAAARDRAFT_191094 [Jaapia argillacea MUCL 33604]|uniref:Cleavage/polyadenylation specificity factor A subunit N-terminal domain-containing protein n=1 Tax=Jaapia argillacea MUCL 33604 TaxID=933084 RepID=A0A067Q1Z6_9AGAM|nr:hypothetical protein JAAARDRAFT_191094 [Jaapia argillacea MUCL 33604]